MSTATEKRVKELLAANADYAKTYTGAPQMVQMRQRDGARVFVVTCMDPRAVPEVFLGPQPQVAVFRNAGGRYSPDVTRSITMLRSLSLKAEGIVVMVVHHTDCGATHLTTEGIRADVKARGHGDVEGLDEMDFGVFSEAGLDDAVREDVEKFKADRLLEGIEVKGYVLSNETGQLREV